MKKVLFILIMMISNFVYSQDYGLSVGASINREADNLILSDIYIITNKYHVIKCFFNTCISKEVQTSNGELSDVSIKDSKEYTKYIFGFGFGERYDNIFANALVGITNLRTYNQYKDINGNYFYKSGRTIPSVDIGGEAGIIFNNFTISLIFTRYTEFGFKMGYIFQEKRKYHRR